jgi:RNA polymerase sigma-70 factor, ECF subfamily
MAFPEFQVALSALTPRHREALVLMSAWGFSNEDAASNANCAIGTMKSRMACARGKLAKAIAGGESSSVEIPNRAQPSLSAGSF